MVESDKKSAYTKHDLELIEKIRLPYNSKQRQYKILTDFLNYKTAELLKEEVIPGQVIQESATHLTDRLYDELLAERETVKRQAIEIIALRQLFEHNEKKIEKL